MALDLNEKIGIHFTREEWAVIVIGLSHVGPTQKIDEISDWLTQQIQHAAAPVGVIVRTLTKNGNG